MFSYFVISEFTSGFLIFSLSFGCILLLILCIFLELFPRGSRPTVRSLVERHPVFGLGDRATAVTPRLGVFYQVPVSHLVNQQHDA